MFRISLLTIFSVFLTSSAHLMAFESRGNDYIFHGYKMEEFIFQGRDAKIVYPDHPAEGRPWIWRARFWGHEPQVDLSLLKKGFHLVYMDVAGMWGNNEAVELWTGFYKHVAQEYQLNKRVALEGMSRGGLIVYNWAINNTDKLACIYADAPVLALNSWPGTSGYEKLWEECLTAYGLNSGNYKTYKDLPLYRTEIIARAGIPVIHVCGKADKVVPYRKNTGKFARRLRRSGGKIELIVKKGVGHHPHSLEDAQPIVDFILKYSMESPPL